MMNVTFGGAAPYGFTAALTTGTWTRVEVIADQSISGGGLRLLTFTPTNLEVTDCHLPALTFEAVESATPRLVIAVQNTSGQAVSIDVPGEASVVLAAGDQVTITYP